MTECEYCKLINEKKAKIVYEDDNLFAFMAKKPASIGHVIVLPKKHHTIMENLDDKEIAYMFNVANKLSIAAFEALEMQGTNIIIQNGVAAGQTKAHFCINIIPRRENDGLDFAWKTKKLSEEEISTVELKIKDEVEKINFAVKEEEIKEEAQKEVKKTETIPETEDNYLIRQLRRVP